MRSLLFIFALGVLPALPQAKVSVNQKSGNCSVTNNGSNNTSSITCVGVDPKLAENIRDIVNLTQGNAKAIALLKQDMMRTFASMKQEIERDPFSGILYPGSDPDPAEPPGCVGPSGAVKVFLGSSLAFAPRFPAKLVSLGNGVVLALDKSRDGLLIDAIVTDSDGRMIADIRKNLFTINQNNVFRRERPDKSTIRVIDQFNRQVLYVRYLNSHAVKILGSFTEPVNPGPRLGTGRFTITDEEIVPSGWGVREGVSIKGGCGGGFSLMFCLWCIPDSPYMYGTRRPPSSQPSRP